MPTFSFRAYTQTGDLSESEVEAANSEEAVDLLWRRGLTTFEMREARSGRSATPWWNRELFAARPFRAVDIASFTREFAILEQAGVAIDDALRILCEQGSNEAMRLLCADILRSILSGSTFSAALSTHPQAFSEEYIAMVRAGELDGALGRVLSDVAALLEARIELQSKLRTALIYPAILIAMSFASTAIVIGVLIPNIAPILSEGGRTPPASIAFLLVIQRNWLDVLICLLSISAGLALGIRSALARAALRLRFDRFLVKTPLIGAFLAKMDCARFTRTLGALMRAKVPLLQALDSARAVVLNRHIYAQLNDVIDEVRDGERLARALSLVESWPAIVTRMASVGEEAGKLDQMLLRLSDIFGQQAQRQIDRGMSLLTPALTVLIAFFIGGLIYTVMNAILSINEMALR